MRLTTQRRYRKIYKEYEQLNADGYRYDVICKRLAQRWCVSDRTIETAIQWARRDMQSK